MIPIFIGFDPRESIAYSVLAHSILSRASEPVSITPLCLKTLPTNRRGSTDFSFSRFLVPWLCNYQGQAIFMDCDMLCLGDIAELWKLRDPDYLLHGSAVKVVKHDYHSEGTKFLGEKQIPYERKNWSSVIIFNNHLCKKLTPEYVNSAEGLDLHQFRWLWDSDIGSLPEEWNHLVGHSKGKPKLVHYTLGGPYFKDCAMCEFSDEWFREKRDMDKGD